MPDVIVTAINRIGEVGDNFAKFLAIGSTGEGFKLQLVTESKPEVGTDIDTEEPVRGKDLTENAFTCIRALALVQDLVADKGWFDEGMKDATLKKNNGILEELTESQPFKESIELLKGSRDLQSDFRLQFKQTFENGNIQELGERFVQIQRLYLELIQNFAPASD
jgi:hypothetical protein